MSLHRQEWDTETARLQMVMKEIVRQLEHYGELSGYRKDHVIDVRKYIWEELRVDGSSIEASIETAADIVQNSMELARIERGYLASQENVHRLKKLQDSPYFGRIDFLEKGTQAAEPIYIGLASLVDDDSFQQLIYDWRAPIAGLYYDHSLGLAEYTSPGGTISGELQLKRQYKIVRNQIEYMFDTGLQIGDEMLRHMLSKSADDKMKSIVTTIQQEQNQVIRNDRHPVLIVQGAAGSGKTSIALQRVAYLLYKYRKTLHADQMILFSPNPIFSDYVSQVLPELGEANMRQTTWQEYAEHRLGTSIQVEDRYAQMEDVLTSRAEDRYRVKKNSIQYKVSPHYVQLIQHYIEHLAGEGMLFENILYKEKVWVEGNRLVQLFYDKLMHIPIHSRLERIQEWLLQQLQKLEQTQTEKIYRQMLAHPKYLGTELQMMRRSKNEVKAIIEPMRESVQALHFLNPLKIYSKLFSSLRTFTLAAEGMDIPEDWEAIRAYTLARLQQGIVPYEDAAPLLYLKEAITGFGSFNTIRHVIIDEAQDYSPFQFEIIRRLFPRGRMTLLGDLNQAIQPHMDIHSYEWMEALFGKEHTEIVRLKKSYRSTTQIVEFTKAILPGGEAIEAISRDGDLPAMTRVPSETALIEAVTHDIAAFEHDEGTHSIAILCKTALESEQAYQLLDGRFELQLVTKEDIKLPNGIIILPVYLAKGLEFDAVLVFDASHAVYGEEEDRKLLYTACTRAMHHLRLFSSGEWSPFVAEINPALYDNQSGEMQMREQN